MPAILPLPVGEGRGEGGQTNRPPQSQRISTGGTSELRPFPGGKGALLPIPSADGTLASMNLKTSSLLGFAAAILVLGIGAAAAADAARRPNIAVILVDDMGFSDLGCYGSEIPTPNLDKLAAGGLRFTQFYNTGRCCPTRASLLTGLYPHQAGRRAHGHRPQAAGLPGEPQRPLRDDCRSAAQRRLPHRHGGQMARDEVHGTGERCREGELAPAEGIRSLFRRYQRHCQLFPTRFIDA